MYKVTVIDSMEPVRHKRTVATYLYNDFRHAFSDVVCGKHDMFNYLDDISRGDFDPTKPESISIPSVRKDGYGDDFTFFYQNGIRIVIADALIEDEKVREE